MKNGWHPEKSGSSLKGSVSGLMGRGKDSTSDSSNHIARPLSDLKDPASFAPPPKRTSSGLAPAPPSASTKRKVITSPSNYTDPRADPVEPPPRNTGVQAIEAPPASQDEGPQPPKPYRVNTTGLSTQHLPKPPARRDEANGRNPPPYSEAAIPTPAPKALPPSLPPRLPPRGATSSPAGNEKSNGLINLGSINRLGAAGVSVPALGIGRGLSANTSSPPPPAAERSAGLGSGKLGSQVNELPGRFANMGNLSAASPAQEPPAQGTTWAQKQAALKTASNFHKDPSSVSFTDAKTAATTANNFRQRHGEQVASGIKTANNLNQKYGVMDRIGTYTGSQTTHAQPRTSPPVLPGPGQAYTGFSSENSPAAPSGVAGKKKPPPPPPKKKLVAAAPAEFASREDEAPPPIPMSTRPAF